MSRAPKTKTCESCGWLFSKDPRNTWAYWEKAKYCSQACAGSAWSRQRAAVRPTLREKFEEKYRQSEGCWEWTGAVDKDGYGIFSYARKTYRAPVMAIVLDGRQIAPGLYACHTCDNPKCVRPSHLYPGTPTQNMADAKARGRVRTGESHHFARLTADDVRAIRQAQGTHSEIAAAFGVSPANVTMIRNRKTWASLP